VKHKKENKGQVKASETIFHPNHERKVRLHEIQRKSSRKEMSEMIGWY